MTDIKDELDLIWGAAAIGRALNLTKRQAFHMLEKGEIAGARKICSKWCVSRHKLREVFGLTEAA